MRNKAGWTVTLSLLLLGLSPAAKALTVGEFLAICEQAERDCREVPVVNAYIGGGLDLIATLHEATDYMEPVYCKSPELLFDVPAIIQYISDNREGAEERNAMLMFVRFFEEYGGC